MSRLFVITLVLFTLSAPLTLSANDHLAMLEAVVAANKQVQPGLQHYQATVETSRVEEMMSGMTSGMPADIEPPPTPVITKFWQRDGQSLVFANQAQLTPYVEKMAEQLSANLAVELNEMLLPAARVDLRRELTKNASLKSSEVALADQLIHRVEIIFTEPTDLNEAFYAKGMRLPQKQIKTLIFDIDARTNTISDLALTTDTGLHLAVEIRYRAVAGGYLPERFQITSPDGKIDDLFEVKFTEVEGHLLPASMLRIIRRPELQENLEVFFKDYQINQPISEDIQARFKSQ